MYHSHATNSLFLYIFNSDTIATPTHCAVFLAACPFLPVPVHSNLCHMPQPPRYTPHTRSDGDVAPPTPTPGALLYDRFIARYALPDLTTDMGSGNQLPIFASPQTSVRYSTA